HSYECSEDPYGDCRENYPNGYRKASGRVTRILNTALKLVDNIKDKNIPKLDFNIQHDSMELFDLTLRNWLIIITAVIALSFLLFMVFRSKKIVYKGLAATIYILLTVSSALILQNWSYTLLYLSLPSLILSLVLYAWTYRKPSDPVWDIEFVTSQG